MIVSCASRTIGGLRVITQQVAAFHASKVLSAEPLKKKKKLDPAIVRAREQRKIKRIEKSIRKLERVGRPLKPLEEMEVPMSLRNEINIRTRKLEPVTNELQLSRKETLIKWCQHKSLEAESDLACITRLLKAQEKALKELRLESEELYIEATQVDPGLLPYKAVGPTSTPKIKGYDPPDGDYVDVSRKWE